MLPILKQKKDSTACHLYKSSVTARKTNLITACACKNNASINVKPKGGAGDLGHTVCGAFDFSEEFLVKIPIMGPQIWSNWIKYTHFENE